MEGGIKQSLPTDKHETKIQIKIIAFINVLLIVDKQHIIIIIIKELRRYDNLVL